MRGQPRKYVSNAERQKAYHRKKALLKIKSGERIGVLNHTTGRINKVKVKKPKISLNIVK